MVRWWSDELPAAVQQKEEPFLDKDEVIKLVSWSPWLLCMQNIQGASMQVLALLLCDHSTSPELAVLQGRLETDKRQMATKAT